MHIPQLLAALAGTACAAVVSAPTAPESEGLDPSLTRRTGAVYKVKDLTGPDLTGQFKAGLTDLGIPARTPDGRLIFLFGDTFENAIGEQDTWRAPVALYSSSTDLDDVLIDGAVGGESAVGLVPEDHAGSTTALPSDVFAINDKLYMNLMRGKIYETHHTDFWVSSDNGSSWDYLFLWPGDAHNSAFQQKTCATDDKYAYCLSSVFNRDVVSDLLLHRVPLDSIENADAWEPWGYENGKWAWGNTPSTVAPARRWGEISWRNLGKNKWVFTWLNMDPLGIHYMVLKGPTDNMFNKEESTLILPADDLGSEHDNYVASPYGGFIFPGATVDKFDFAVSQWTPNDEAYRVMQFRADGL